MKILNGKELSEIIINKLCIEVNELKKNNIIPKIVIVKVGDDFASGVYVKNKKKLCDKIGIECEIKLFDEKITEDELKKTIINLNNDKSVNGILVQLPLPKHICEENILNLVSIIKDVDCFNFYNIGKLWTLKKNDPTIIMPCTPWGIITLLKNNNIELEGKNVVIVGRSNIVGKPLAALFTLENSTITLAHSKTKNLQSICKNADILVCAIGKSKFFTKEYCNENQVVVDVGINRNENNKICGDADYENIVDYVNAITPVPGGVGPMTITILLDNIIKVTKLQYEKKS